MNSAERGDRDEEGGQLIHLFEFLEPPAPKDLGNSPAPAMGEDGPEPAPEEDVWFAEAAEQIPPEPATVLVPEELIRMALELGERSANELPPPAPVEAREESWIPLGRGSEPTPRSSKPVERMKPGAALVFDFGASADDRAPQPDEYDDFELDQDSRDPRGIRISSLISPFAVGLSALAIIMSVLALASRNEILAADLEERGAAKTILLLPAMSLEPQDQASTREESPTPQQEPTLVQAGVLGVEETGGVLGQSPRSRRPGRAIQAPTASRTERQSAPSARFLRNGRAWFDRGRYRTALSWYARAAVAAPNDPRARFGVALSAFEMGDDELATGSLESTVRDHPSHPESQLLLGFLRQAEGSRQSAVEHYRRYLELAPEGEWAEEVRTVLSRLER